ncbi:M57 family metalloprotease [Aquimarina intermedia]|uniref:Dual-action HEIGH metallo-peptidase n=1 Tax=Aquimarina intermedia TaxID=350814 RepID=A0A5S5C7I5_9FLAO|nr:M57 family metalloprotease [Aquimarina intermedia]TYP75304.1 dual-action HEIGH metallo-peptidase [Aquimarina intermedia]
MKNLKTLALCAFIAGCIVACQKEDLSDTTVEQINLEETQEPTKTQLDKLFKMGVNIEQVTIQDIPLPDGSKEKYLVSGDITIPVDDLAEYPDLKSSDGKNKQYHSDFIVAPPYRNIRVLGWTGTGSSFDLTPKMRTALSWAVANYNALPNTLNFTLSYGNNQSQADMVVYRVIGGAGGSAGFPTSAGRPNRYVRINSGLDSGTYSLNVVEHVIGHEIGHSVGFRHQDWYNRWSCGYTGPLPAEPSVSPAAIWIPGTPWSPYADSIMLGCFNTGEDGEFTASDRDALNILY